MKRYLKIGTVFLVAVAPLFASAQGTLLVDRTTTVLARVVSVVSQETRVVPGTDVKDLYQTLRVRIEDGEESGKEISVANDFLQLSVGDQFYLSKTVSAENGSEQYAVLEPYRLPTLFFSFFS